MGTEGLSASRCWALMNPLLQPERHGQVAWYGILPKPAFPCPFMTHIVTSRLPCLPPACLPAEWQPHVLGCFYSFGIVLNTKCVNKEHYYDCGHGDAAGVWSVVWAQPAGPPLVWSRLLLTHAGHSSPIIHRSGPAPHPPWAAIPHSPLSQLIPVFLFERVCTVIV